MLNFGCMKIIKNLYKTLLEDKLRFVYACFMIGVFDVWCLIAVIGWKWMCWRGNNELGSIDECAD